MLARTRFWLFTLFCTVTTFISSLAIVLVLHATHAPTAFLLLAAAPTLMLIVLAPGPDHAEDDNSEPSGLASANHA